MSISGAAIKVSITAWDAVNQVGKTGLGASTFTLEVAADGADLSAITSTGNIVEDGNGEYFVTLTGAQNTGTMMSLRGSNSSTGIVVIPAKWNNLPALPYSGTPPTAAAIATAVWTDTTAGDFTAAGSPGKELQTTLPAAVSAIPTAASVQAATAAALAVAFPTAPFVQVDEQFTDTVTVLDESGHPVILPRSCVEFGWIVSGSTDAYNGLYAFQHTLAGDVPVDPLNLALGGTYYGRPSDGTLNSGTSPLFYWDGSQWELTLDDGNVYVPDTPANLCGRWHSAGSAPTAYMWVRPASLDVTGIPAASATAVWTDTTGADFGTNGSPGKELLLTLPAAVSAIPTTPLLASDTRLPSTTIAAQADVAAIPLSPILLVAAFSGDVTGYVGYYLPSAAQEWTESGNSDLTITSNGATWQIGNAGGAPTLFGPAVGGPNLPFGLYTDGAGNSATVSMGDSAAPTAAEIATAVWTDTTAGDFTTPASPGQAVQQQAIGLPAAVWQAAQRTLTGTGGAIGPTAGISTADIPLPGGWHPGQTRPLAAQVYDGSGSYATVEETANIAYTVVDCDTGEPVPGMIGITLTPASVLYDTMQTSGDWGNYNFRFTPLPFPEAGTYLIVVTFTGTSGKTWWANFRGRVEW